MKFFPVAASALALASMFQVQAQTTSREERARAEIQKVENLLPQIPDRGAALYLLAIRYMHLGDSQKTLALLKECVALNQGFDPGSASEFQRLLSNPEFRALDEQVRRANPPVHRAKVAFTVDQSDLFPEGLAYDSQRHLFYMGSMHRKKILKITERGEASDFVPPERDELMPVGGIKVEPDHSIWAATDPGDKNRSELVHFDGAGKLLERYPITSPGPHDLNDLVVRNGHQIYTTDTDAGEVYRFDRETHFFTPVMFPRPLFYPNGIALSGDNNLLYVADILGVIRVDLRDNSAKEIQPGHDTLSGIDGLYWYKGDLLGVQYGTGAYRVMRWHLANDGLRVDSSTVLERGTPLVSDPTTGAIVGTKFYYIANTGIGNLKDDKIVDPKKLEPVHVAVVSLE